MSKKNKNSGLPQPTELSAKQDEAAIGDGMRAVKEGAPLFPMSNVLHKMREREEQKQRNKK